VLIRIDEEKMRHWAGLQGLLSSRHVDLGDTLLAATKKQQRSTDKLLLLTTELSHFPCLKALALITLSSSKMNKSIGTRIK